MSKPRVHVEGLPYLCMCLPCRTRRRTMQRQPLTAGMRKWLEGAAMESARRTVLAGAEARAVASGDRVALVLDGQLFEPRALSGSVYCARISRAAAVRLLRHLTAILSTEETPKG